MANVHKDKKFNPSFSVTGNASKKTPWKDDVLDRQRFAKPLTDLVSSADDAPFCIAIDGEWGCGKTFLLERWRIEFSEKGKVIYFNAWEDDFHADPLTAIIGQLWDEIKKGKMKDIRNLLGKDWEKALKETMSDISPKKALLNISSFGVKLGDFQPAIVRTVEEYIERRRSVKILQKQLQKLAKVTKEKTKKPLVFIVDELDRCRPTFAIELLERVKHVVGVPGIVFVFGVNQKGLEESIRSVYGDLDATDYLRRFFDVGMTLPKAKASQYCSYLINKHKIVKTIEKSPIHQKTYGLRYIRKGIKWKGGWDISVKDDMPAMVGYMGLSLRQIEQAVRMLSIVLRSKEIAKPNTMYWSEGALVAFILLRIKNRDLYVKFINKNCTAKDVLDSILPSLSREVNYRILWRRDSLVSMARIISVFYIFNSRSERQEIINEFEQVSRGLSGQGTLPSTCHHVPQKIIDMGNRHSATRRAYYLIEQIKLMMPMDMSYPSRQAIFRLLEWGDYWRL